MSEDNEDATNKEMRLYAEKAKRRKEGVAFNDKGNMRNSISDTYRPNASNVQNVNVVGLNIPFWDLVTLTIYNGFAVLLGIFIILIVVGLPVLLISMGVVMGGGSLGILGLILSLGWIIFVVWFMRPSNKMY